VEKRVIHHSFFRSKRMGYMIMDFMLKMAVFREKRLSVFERGNLN